MPDMEAIRVGCGSWSDKEYAPLLDPHGENRQRPLAAYAHWFDHAEVNSSYYAIPKANAVRQWIEQTPPGFLFDVKLHRVLSMAPARAEKTGGEKRDLVAALLDALEPLIEAKKFGAFLLVLAPHFRPDKHELSELDALAERLRPHPLAVELRDRGWITGAQRDQTLAYFREHGLTWVTVDMPRLKDDSQFPFIDEVTTPNLAYVRLHGRNPKYLEAASAAERHAYLYPPRELAALAQRMKKIAAMAKDVRVVANNHAKDYAPRTALSLKALLERTDPR